MLSRNSSKSSVVSSSSLAAMIDSHIAQQEQRVCDMDKLIAHTIKLAHVRLLDSSGNGNDNKGAELSIKQVIKYSAEKERASTMIAALTELALRIQWHGEVAVNCQSELETILQEPAPHLEGGKEDAEEILVEARKSLLAAKMSRKDRKQSRPTVVMATSHRETAICAIR